MKKLIQLLLIITCIASCLPEPNSTRNNETEKSVNPLDSILGEKIINEETRDLQEENFSVLKNISRKNLESHSSNYDVESVSEDFYVLNQHKFYSQARLFSILLKIDNKKTVAYLVKKDFKIIDHFKDKEGLTVLYGNFGNRYKQGERNNEVELIRFDNELNEVWNYAPKSSIASLEALEIENKNTFTKVNINVISGCDICKSKFELKIDNEGNCISAVETGRQNSTISFERSTIKEIFKIP